MASLKRFPFGKNSEFERVLERDRKKSNLEMEDLKRSKLGMRATARCLCKHNSVEGKI